MLDDASDISLLGDIAAHAQHFTAGLVAQSGGSLDRLVGVAVGDHHTRAGTGESS